MFRCYYLNLIGTPGQKGLQLAVNIRLRITKDKIREVKRGLRTVIYCTDYFLTISSLFFNFEPLFLNHKLRCLLTFTQVWQIVGKVPYGAILKK